MMRMAKILSCVIVAMQLCRTAVAQVPRPSPIFRFDSLGLILSDIRNPFFAEVARGAEDAARAGNCDLVLCNSDLDADKQMHYVRSLLEKRIDGILMNSVSALSRDQQAQLTASDVQIVLLNRPASNQ